jgi:Histidinol-phosphate/aromatic aminotransferase and cobyric acid decarboxylase
MEKTASSLAGECAGGARGIESLQDKAHSAASRRFVTEERTRLWRDMQSLTGVHPLPSHANFYFAHLDYSAAELYLWMLDRNMILRNCTGWPGIQGEAFDLPSGLPLKTTA